MSDTQEDQIEEARAGKGSFPRAIPEDCIEYTIFWLNEALSEIERRDKLRQVQGAGTALLKKHLKDYIWEQDSFNLNLSKYEGLDYLCGRSSYGDSVEDEWIVVWLCVELSKKFEDAWIRVSDADGEFLLIEAANALPKWLNPEIADYRVWINQGHLHIIPQQQEKGDLHAQYSGSLTLTRAMEFLNKAKSQLLSDSKIENEAFFRIQKYPNKTADNFHHALVNISRKMAFLLYKNQAYISPAIEAFYLRDPIALKSIQAANTGALRFPPTDLCTCLIKFTKVGFAKMRSQNFSYPANWLAMTEPTAGTPEAFQSEMGMKLTCGFEMLLADPQNKDKKVVREIELVLGDLEEGEETLPTDLDIKDRGTTEDNDSWLDIDYQDFEKELAGRSTVNTKKSGFGDLNAHEKLQKMVSRFEELMTAETENGLDLDDMDNDNDSDAASSDSDNESHNSAEEDFNEMMREMLGMSKETMDELMGNTTTKALDKGKARESLFDAEDPADYAEIQRLSAAMEAELKASGALKLHTTKETKKLPKSKTADLDQEEEEEEDGSSDEEYLDEDYNLAKNMLESFKSQAGATGPAGNLMSMLGMQPPRDDHDSD